MPDALNPKPMAAYTAPVNIPTVKTDTNTLPPRHVWFSRNAPAIAACALLAGLLAIPGLHAQRLNEGHLAYTLDDPYIHMAIAKNLAQTHVFGVTPYAFSSASSSPLWTLLLAALFKLVGLQTWLPGACALLAAFGALFLANAIAIHGGLGTRARLITCALIAYLTPLPSLVSTGMEHALHVFFVLLLLRAMLRSLAPSPPRADAAWLCAASALATATRYETLFIIAPCGLVLLMHKRWKPAFLMGLSAALPVLIYGLFSIAHGIDFLPNSLMLKGQFHTFSGAAIRALLIAPHMAALAIPLLLAALPAAHRRAPWRWLCLTLPCAMLLHLQFANTGWFFRYESYLMGAGILAACLAWLPYLQAALAPMAAAPVRRRGILIFALFGAAILPLNARAVESLRRIVPASRHIYHQQIQNGRFIAKYLPPKSRVAVTDLGAITFFTDADVLDLFGLGNVDVARAKRQGTYNTATIAHWLHDRDIEAVIVYAYMFQGESALPGFLVPAFSLTTLNHYWGPVVTYFGTSVERARHLQEAFRRFQTELPPGVSVETYAPVPLSAQ